MPKQDIDSFKATKCVVDALHSVTGSDGPEGTPESRSFRHIREASKTDFTQLTIGEFQDVQGLRLKSFVAGDCSVLTDDRMQAIWDSTVQTAGFYWHNNPHLPNPFPADRFAQPDMDCEKTAVTDLVATVRTEWVEAQP
jgi:hypothetical protein